MNPRLLAPDPQSSRPSPLAGRRIALGVTGSIAAYKAVAVVSSLVQQGAVVDVVMTPDATQFVQPLSFQAITHRQVAVDMFHLLAETEIGHVTIGHQAEVLVIAPATAHSIAKLALGLADDMVATTALATQAPVVYAPAMETNMWRHPATQEHVQTLRGRGWTVVEPESGYLASGSTGEGRMAAPERIVDTLRHVLSRGGDLGDWRVTVTAGGTREPIDPVRYISNRSSGKMGVALAEAARDRGADVVLITTMDPPQMMGVRPVVVERAEEMRDAVMGALDANDALVMAAAVADYRPAQAAREKIKKADQTQSVALAPTVDILEDVTEARGARTRPIVVGFAAETEHVVENARRKLDRKRLDLMVVNDVSEPDSVFASDFNTVTILHTTGADVSLPRLHKLEVAHRVWDEILALAR